MGFRVHRAETLAWRKIGDIEMGDMRNHIDATELEGHLAFHEPGDAATPQLMEMRLNPHTLIAPHSHDDDEIFFVAAGSLHWAIRHWRKAAPSSSPPARNIVSAPGRRVYACSTSAPAPTIVSARPAKAAEKTRSFVL